ncbi:hypothetical protein BJY16_001820 [Actinoplanes octamycinicus]|uniref:DUF4265 domain-containing protein n=1 Tax=Actinoplanes octamycinicus TaxID=135948 RepID=A0A7W7M666_9ACTN|nr:DUF4265 domain-containing protein [Actinoplanes octamycinicus]MBB4738361.1 hypothetical protein [Actinoplanes octamycinicus]GIE57478.1 hypothetical protein Aoc01nite_28800 [Actinoplanes octamycinicus]
MNQTLVEVFIGNRDDGSPVFEKLWVDGLDDGSYRLVRTPKLALGLAREDTFRVDELGNIHDVRSGGYFAFQVVLEGVFTKQSLDELVRLPESYGGSFDVHDDQVAGLAVPATANVDGFLEELVRYLQRYPGVYWNSGDATPDVRTAQDR